MKAGTFDLVIGEYAGHKLLGPVEFFQATQEEKDEVAGGCGPGGWGDLLVPDKIIGEDIAPACKIHDWMYYWGESEYDKLIADLTLQWNISSIIMVKYEIGDIARLKVGTDYVIAVWTLGDKAFLAGKPGFRERKE